jgi:hypothetical protein
MNIFKSLWGLEHTDLMLAVKYTLLKRLTLVFFFFFGEYIMKTKIWSKTKTLFFLSYRLKKSVENECNGSE